MREVTIYTDGSCYPNPGPGAWAWSAVDSDFVSSGFNPEITTNNRMELEAVIAGLSYYASDDQPCKIHVKTDSQYVMHGFTKNWVRSWIRRGWVKSDGTPVGNRDLWETLLELVQFHSVTWEWVRGHSGDPMNEKVDKAAGITSAQGKERIAKVFSMVSDD